MPEPDFASDAPKRQLTLFDSVSIIVGIIIGVGFYETTPLIASNVTNATALIGIWILGGVLSLVGALCYAELATAYPRSGGDYVYLTRAFGRPIGFLFAWSQLWVVRPGSIGALAYVFARYANQLFPLGKYAFLIYASASVLLLTAINILGVRQGKWTQNLLTTAKVLGLLLVFGVAFLAGGAPASAQAGSAATVTGKTSFELAMILVLFTYGGWNEMAYVGAELRDPARNVLRALVLGTAGVTLIYVLASAAFLIALGFDNTRSSKAVAADVLELGFKDWGAKGISVLIVISALGAINGQIFTGARIYYAMGQDHRLYAPLGLWHSRLGTPVWSLVVQGIITLALVFAFGVSAFFPDKSKAPSADPIGPTAEQPVRLDEAFQSMVKFTTPPFFFFLVLVGLSLFVLRWRDPDAPRTYRVHGFPVTPIVFCLSSSFMVYASLRYAIENASYEGIWAIAILAVGCLFCFQSWRPNSSGGKLPQEHST